MLSKRAYKWIAIVAFCGLGLNSAATAKLYNDKSNEALHRDQANRALLLANCQTVGDPLLRAQIHSNKSEIARTRAGLRRAKGIDLDALADKLGLTKAQIEAGQQDQRDTITTDQYILRPLLAAPTCAQRYPPVTE